MSKGELWNILPYAGLWGAAPECGIIKNLEAPPVNKTNLAGIPFSGDNSGANPNLRVISFYADRLDGPISSTGPRSTFFRSYLNYKISWKIEPIDDETLDAEVQIGFYTAPYTANSPGPDNMLLMLEENGPALYRANSCNKFRGCFKTSEVSDLYVIVDANVIVKLKITSFLPGEIEVPCFTELFKPYKYLSKCGELLATQYLVDSETGETLIRPVKKYVNTSKRMIDYLFATSVNIVLFEDPTNGSLNSNKSRLSVETGRLVKIFPYGNLTQKELSQRITFSGNLFNLYTYGFPEVSRGTKNNDNWSLVLLRDWQEKSYKVYYKISIEIPIRKFKPLVTFAGFAEVGGYSGLKWNGYQNGLVRLPGEYVGGTTTEVEGTLLPNEIATTMGFRVGFDGSTASIGNSPVPIVRLLYLAVEYFDAS